MAYLEYVLQKLSRGNNETSLSKEFELIGNCFAFLNLKGGTGTSTLIMELATLTSKRGLHTCIVDCNPTSNFYLPRALPNLEDKNSVPSIDIRFQKSKCELSECLMPLNASCKLLCFGDSNLMSSFDMNLETIEELFEEVKDVFDVVFFDVPFLPWIETTLVAVNCASIVYTTTGFGAESLLAYSRARAVFDHAGLSYKLSTILIMGTPEGKSLKKVFESSIKGAKVLAEVPLIPDIAKLSLNYNIILDELRGSQGALYAQCLEMLFNEIVNGINSKEDSNKNSVEEEHDTKTGTKFNLPKLNFKSSKKQKKGGDE